MKFKEQAADTLKRALVRGERLHEVSISPSLDAVKIKYGLKNMRMLFPSFQVKDASGAVLRVETIDEHLAKIRQRFPARATREPGPCHPPDLTRWYALELDAEADVLAAAADYAQEQAVEKAHPDYVAQAYAWDPNDFYYNTEEGSWGQDYKDLWGLERIGCRYAWDYSKGSGIVIAVIDTGIDYREKPRGNAEDTGHPDIVPNLWINHDEYYGEDGVDDDNNGYVDDKHGWNFVEPKSDPPKDKDPYSDPEDSEDDDPMDFRGHGTHVAGTATAVGHSETAIVGVAPSARVMNVKVLSRKGLTLGSWIGDGILYAADNGADVLNLSLGWTVDHWGIRDAVGYAWQLGCVVVCAAGKYNLNVGTDFPAGYKRTIAVAATNQQDQKSAFSDWGTGIDLAAPGGDADDAGHDILSLRAQDTYTGKGQAQYIVDAEEVGNGEDCLRLCGTSMACPHVAGVAALFLSVHPTGYSNEELRQAIRRTADDLGAAGRDDLYGYGRVNAASATTGGHQCEALILQPEDSQVLIREADEPLMVQGIADGLYFHHWKTEYRLKEVDQEWSLLAEGYDPLPAPWGGSMGWTYFDEMPGGQYIIRLTVDDAYGQKYYDYVSLLIYTAVCEPDYYRVRSSPLIADLCAAQAGEELALSFCEPPPATPGPFVGLRTFYADGGLCWETTLVGETESSPVAAELCSHPGPELVLACCADQTWKVRALHSDGTPCWEHPVIVVGIPKASPAVAVLVDDGGHPGPDVVFGDWMGTLYCLYGEDGTVAWSFQTDGASWIHSTPAIDDIDPNSPGLEVAFADVGGNVYVLSSGGARLHKFTAGAGDRIVSSPSLANLDANYSDLEIVVGSDDGNVYAFSISSPQEPLWTYQTGAPVRSSPAVADLVEWRWFQVVVTSDSGMVHCLYPDGSPAWTFDTGAQVELPWQVQRPSPAIADLDPSRYGPEVIVASLNGRVYVLHGDDGSLHWAFSTDPGVWDHQCQCSPAIGDIRPDFDGLEMTIAPDDLNIYIFHFPGTAVGKMPWPVFKHDPQHTGRYEWGS